MDEQLLEAMKLAGREAARGMDSRIPDTIVTAAHSVIAGKVAELEEALRFAHDTLVEQRVARIIRTDLRAGGLADMISAIVNKARAALAPYPERRSE